MHDSPYQGGVRAGHLGEGRKGTCEPSVCDCRDVLGGHAWSQCLEHCGGGEGEEVGLHKTSTSYAPKVHRLFPL